MTPIQSLIANRLAELDLSYRAAAERSRGLISHSTIFSMVTGRRVGPWSDRTLSGLALALDLPAQTVKEIAHQHIPKTVEFKLPAKANRLTPKQRMVVLQVVDGLLQAKE